MEGGRIAGLQAVDPTRLQDDPLNASPASVARVATARHREPDIQQWVADKFRQHQGWQTVRNSWILLSSILETAVEYGYLQSNPRGA